MTTIERMKIAVAVSILRKKPNNLSGKEYAEILCNQYQRSQLNWKERYENMTDEVLCLKQELVLSEMNRESIPILGNGAGIEHRPELIYPTPPASSETPQLLKSKDQIATLQKDELFLQCCIQIRALNQYKHVQSSLDAIETKTMCRCLKIIEENLTSRNNGILLRTALSCIEVLSGLLSKVGKTQTLSHGIKESLESLIISLVNRLQKRKDHNEVEVMELCTKLLIELGKCPNLSWIVLDETMNCIEMFSEHLREICLDEISFSKLDADSFSNTFYLLKVLEKCLDHLTDCSFTKKAADLDFIASLHERLENCLLHVIDKFPLFAHAVWRITSLINIVT